MRPARLLTASCSIPTIGGLPNPLGCRPPLEVEPPRCRPPPNADPSPDADAPCHVTCDACWEANPPVNRMIHKCKNITLPQTSFAIGNKKALQQDTGVLSRGKVLSITGSDIIPPPVDRQTLLKTLPCPKLSFAGGQKYVMKVNSPNMFYVNWFRF